MARLVGVWAVVLGVFVYLAPAAYALFFVNVAPDFPDTVVGQTAPASLGINNYATVHFRNIDLYPSCTNTATDCVGGTAESGVYALSATGTGQSIPPGNATCVGTWTLVPDTGNPDTATRYRFLPPGGEGSLVEAPGETCVVNFTITTRRRPTVDVAPATPGVQTNHETGANIVESPRARFGLFDTSTVSPSVPGLSSVAGTNPPQPLPPLPGSTTDTARLTPPPPPAGEFGAPPTGTMTFNLYGPYGLAATLTCTGSPLATQMVAVNGGGAYTSPTPVTVPSPGKYAWVATYSGDANYIGASTVCGDPAETVTFGPSVLQLVTQATPTATIGSPISDTATLSGTPPTAPAPTGTVTFTVFNNPTCTGTPVFTSAPQPLAGGPPPTASSGPFTPTAPGSYNWVAAYSGDLNYGAVTSACGAPNETAVVSRPTPALSTSASGSVLAGGPVHDTATLAGGLSPTGALTFRLYGPNDASCSGPVVFTTTLTVVGTGSYDSPSFATTAPGTYRWTVDYSGDASNNPASSVCNAPNESVVVQPFTPPAFTLILTGDVLGPVVVSPGQSVLVTAARVVGPITVNPGGALTVVSSQVTNGIVANGPAFFSLCGSQVAAPAANRAQGVVVSAATVPIQIGDPANGCPTNRIAGGVSLTNNSGGITFGANFVSRDVTVNNNSGGAVVVKANNVFGTLACSGNNPPPTNAGQPNTAGAKTGQCGGVAGPVTTTSQTLSQGSIAPVSDQPPQLPSIDSIAAPFPMRGTRHHAPARH